MKKYWSSSVVLASLLASAGGCEQPAQGPALVVHAASTPPAVESRAAEQSLDVGDVYDMREIDQTYRPDAAAEETADDQLADEEIGSYDLDDASIDEEVSVGDGDESLGRAQEWAVTPETTTDDLRSRGKPNIVLILTDDLSMNLIDVMPEVQRMKSEGLSFSNYFVSNSLCCPSRSTIFTGKFPHNTGVLGNTGPSGGLSAFESHGNEQQTFASALQNQGYMTALLGKYLNGYHPKSHGPANGWTHWAVAGDGYKEYKYWLNHDGRTIYHGHQWSDYLTDVLANMGTNLIENHAHRRFMIEFSTFAPHAPFRPAHRDQDMFAGVTIPQTPAFGARPGPDAPPWLRDVPPLTPGAIKLLNKKYRKRLRAVQAVDRLIGEVRNTLQAKHIADQTYVIFTSDNGFHLGEHSLRGGKKTAFDHDIHVPLVVVGPGVPRGRTVDAVVQNVDLCPTFRDLAGVGETEQLNGRSLAPFLHGQEPSNWRDAALVEHHHDHGHSDPDRQGRFDGDPPDYHAMRRNHDLYVEYANGAREYYDLRNDPYELDNIYKSLPEDKKHHLRKAVHAMKSCKTASECWASQHVN
jgi:N-acetylglucosamine-6-sulfatase